MNRYLIILFWLVSKLARPSQLTNHSLNLWTQLEMPADFQPSTFLKEKWELDTEIIQGAWFFYLFSKQFYQVFSFRV